MTEQSQINLNQATALLENAKTDKRDELQLPEVIQLLGLAEPGPEGPKQVAFGAGLLVSIECTREFGMVIHAGIGGSDSALFAVNFKKGQALVSAATELTSGKGFLHQFSQTVAYRHLASQGTSDAQLENIFSRFIALANHYSPTNPNAPYVLDELRTNPLVMHNGQWAALEGEARFSRPKAIPAPRPKKKIHSMLHPKSIGIIGVSGSKMNFGRIILKNIIASGYPKEQITIIRPNEEEIDGVKCVDSLEELEGKLDLFVVAIAAEAVFDLVDEVIATDAAESVMLIPGGLGETAASREKAAAMVERMNQAHRGEGGGPVFLGGNCLGIVSHPGGYDTWFIPKNRLPQGQKKARRNSALISQSGAFMITRISKNPWLDPGYMAALGNQNDLTHGDMINYFADNDEIDTIGVYAEGFRDMDGLTFARAVRKATLKGKQVVLYKAGKSQPGQMATMGHTASIAGDYDLCESVVTQAGGIVANNFSDFSDLFYIADRLHDKTIGGNRLGVVSGAGFEAVGMSDSIAVDNFSLEVPPADEPTTARIAEIMKAKRLDALMEVRNPMDINPGADDEAHLQCCEAFAAADNIDAVMVGLDPMSPVMRTLVDNVIRPGYDISDEASIAHQMPKMVDALDKPLIGVIDGGELYDPLVAKMMDQGICVFRSCERGVQALSRYTQARLYREELIAFYS